MKTLLRMLHYRQVATLSVLLFRHRKYDAVKVVTASVGNMADVGTSLLIAMLDDPEFALVVSGAVAAYNDQKHLPKTQIP